MASLPSFFVMQATSQGVFLSVQEAPPSNRPPGFLRFDVPEILSPRVKFAFERSVVDQTLVHIRCCFTNKYWVVHDIQGQLWIGASADKPQEDRTDPVCTLFRVSQSGTQGGFRFLSIARNMNVASSDSGLAVVSWNEPEFRTVDWETLVILLSIIAFRSEDLDGNYLCSRVLEKRNNYHRFESGLDIGDPLVAYELFPTSDGNYRIKSLHHGKFWRKNSITDGFTDVTNWIWADAEDNNNSNDTLFSFVKLDNDVFAIRNLGNNRFCGGHTTTEVKDIRDCLNAHYENISRQTKLKIEERVLKREISDVRYRLADSRIYQEELQELSHAFAINDSPDKESTITLTYSESDSITTHWTNSLSVSFGVTTTFETYHVPAITSVGVALSTEFGYAHEWGVSKTTERTRTASYTVVVPPLTTMKVTHLCSKASSDVPFSYRQRDLLPTGEWISIDKDDGVYKGANTFNFHFQSEKVVPDAQGRVFE
ncbi:uncharacterized protein LOC143539997 [Bidens hawaiensis]|uniref:uncharacterized protein LOC143539997 n=1 Tax=Bidens hawaiensis TaxID=980011 RepID=UPI00404AF58B